MKNLRIFWKVEITQNAGGYYHVFTNRLTKQEEFVWCGWHKNALNKVSTSWEVIKERLK